ncbi:hypothetical protein HanXRQr2_Chr12g0551081 [Helianthus annuus]|uniref:Uncharacterized protein n=2 Tax=Helianthus annuus TaxID=4232 RepID=A0A9K3MWR0_HELAN|nr:hypothetical protein HanXRQr2_Chr12g0551081 [Helianthus annuus]KAJ0863485.1 hypothetical protein HanPSC8_Chr12g0530551 [Helianthus annuus]
MVWVGLWVVTGFGSHIKHGFFPCTNPNFDIHFSGRLTPNLNEDINLSSSRTLIASTIIEHEHNLVVQTFYAIVVQLRFVVKQTFASVVEELIEARTHFQSKESKKSHMDNLARNTLSSMQIARLVAHNQLR